MALHTECRFPNSYSNAEEVAPPRYPVPDEQVLSPTSEFLEGYNKNAPNYTTAKILAKPVYADSFEDRGKIEFNAITTDPTNGEKMDRRNHDLTKPYTVIDNIPQNPNGLTGMKGMGRLGRLGPNLAADALVLRHKREINEDGSVGKSIWRNHKPVLELILGTRKDGLKEKALLGGMEESGDNPFKTAKKEFGEEGQNSKDATPEEKKNIQDRINVLFKNAYHLGRFYVDDPRNTDNSWMVTNVVLAIDMDGLTYQYKLSAGDDIATVGWHEITSDEKGEIKIAGTTRKLYASHSDFVKQGYAYALTQIKLKID